MRYAPFAALFLCTSSLWAETNSTESPALWASLSVRYEQAAWIPWQYRAARDQVKYTYSSMVGDIEGNSIQMTPFVFSFGKRGGLGVEIAYTSLTMGDWRYKALYIYNGRPVGIYTGGADVLHRNEGHALCVLPLATGEHTLSFRFGIERMETFSGYGSPNSSRFVKVPAWGLRTGVAYAYNASGKLSPWFKSDLFWAKGPRIYKSSSANGDGAGVYITNEWGSAATKGEWFGLDTQAGVSWNVLPNVSLDLGYHREVAYFRYIHFYVHALPYENEYATNYYNSGTGNGYSLAGVPSNRDSITGWTIGVTMKTDTM